MNDLEPPEMKPEPPHLPRGRTYMAFRARNGLRILIEMPADEITARADALMALRHATAVILKMPPGAMPVPAPARHSTITENYAALS